MYDDQPHPLLAQVPLTVSPFVSLPTATTLPYTYKSLPSSLPASAISSSHSNTLSSQQPSDNATPKFIVSSSGHAASPGDITESCKALQSHLRKQQENADKTLAAWENEIKERELAEKRRVAPGWLDTDQRVLQPERVSAALSPTLKPSPNLQDSSTTHNPVNDNAGAEIDRAFGGQG